MKLTLNSLAESIKFWKSWNKNHTITNLPAQEDEVIELNQIVNGHSYTFKIKYESCGLLNTKSTIEIIR